LRLLRLGGFLHELLDLSAYLVAVVFVPEEEVAPAGQKQDDAPRDAEEHPGTFRPRSFARGTGGTRRGSPAGRPIQAVAQLGEGMARGLERALGRGLDGFNPRRGFAGRGDRNVLG